MYYHLHLNVSLVDLELKGAEEALDSHAIAESEATQHSSASSHGRRIRWLLSSASLGNIEEEVVSVEPRLESSASGATLEVSICMCLVLAYFYHLVFIMLCQFVSKRFPQWIVG